MIKANAQQRHAAKGAAARHRQSGAISAGSQDISAEQRNHMIAEAAYYLAEQRGFDGSDEMQDWLDAEQRIDEQLRSGNLQSH